MDHKYFQIPRALTEAEKWTLEHLGYSIKTENNITLIRSPYAIPKRTKAA